MLRQPVFNIIMIPQSCKLFQELKCMAVEGGNSFTPKKSSLSIDEITFLR